MRQVAQIRCPAGLAFLHEVHSLGSNYLDVFAMLADHEDGRMVDVGKTKSGCYSCKAFADKEGYRATKGN
jgi:hypothetical protein